MDNQYTPATFDEIINSLPETQNPDFTQNLLAQAEKLEAENKAARKTDKSIEKFDRDDFFSKFTTAYQPKEGEEYVVHMATDPKHIPGTKAYTFTDPETGEEIAMDAQDDDSIGVATFVHFTDSYEEAMEMFAGQNGFTPLMETNSEIVVYAFDNAVDPDSIMPTLESDRRLTLEEHGARIVNYRAFGDEARMTAEEQQAILADTFEPENEPF